jgi:hypothetical protein
MLSTTYAAMNLGAKATNKVINLEDKFKVKPKTNPSVAEAASIIQNLHNLNSLKASADPSTTDILVAKHKLASSRLSYRRVVRAAQAEDRDADDRKLAEILSNNPSAIFSRFRAASKSSAPVVNTMKVGNKVYSGECAPDGVFL